MMLNYLKNSIDEPHKKYLRYLYYSYGGYIGLRQSPCLFNIDKKIEPFLRPRDKHGVFIEAGGNDGVTQSNTFHLERHFGWTGFIVEPIPWLNRLAKRFRTCGVETCALGRFSDRGSVIHLEESDLTTRVAHGSCESGRIVEAPLEPLSDILDRRKIDNVDFFSLDVEGYENAVLDGIDFEKHNIKSFLIETKNPTDLSLDWRLYQEPITITHHDYLILRK